MSFGKTVELYSESGTFDGTVTAELSNWNAMAIRIHRQDIESYEKLKSVGVYFLFCEDKKVYIGESENVYKRLLQHISDYNHDREKYYWPIAVCFISDRWDKASIRYLENRVVELTKDNGSYDALTKDTFKDTKLTDSKISTMEEVVFNIKILIKALGYSLLDGKPKIESEKILECKGNKAEAKGYVSSNGFTVLKGSKISDHIVNSFKTNVPGWPKLREELQNSGVIVDSVFQKDYEFQSPSAASSIILGSPTSGNIKWKKDGKTLKDLNI